MTFKPIGYALLVWFLACAWPREAVASRVERAAFKSEHFEYLIDSSKTELIPYASGLFESSYRRLTEYFDFRPDARIHVLFTDEDDIGNGYAFAAQGWIVIMLTPADFDLRGRTAWLPNVISHELTHVITLRKMGETARFLGLQLSADFSLRGGSLGADVNWRWYRTPSWFAEGLAQFGSQTCGYDTVDTFRRMILETARESHSLLTLPEMADFGWDTRRNEMVYTQGFSLTAYLFGKYGREPMNRVLEAMGHEGFESAFRTVLSKSLREIYGDWVAESARTGTVHPQSQASPGWKGSPRNAAYVDQASPIAAPDGSVAYLSSERNDFGIADLYVRTPSGEHLVKHQATGPLNLSPDGKSLYFTVLSVSGKSGRSIRDLYQYSFSSGTVTRLTWNSRIFAASPASDGAVYALVQNGGHIRLSRLDRNGLAPVCEYPVGINVSALSPGGAPGTLLAEVATGRGTDIYSVSVADGHLAPILASRFDERNPRWDAEGGGLVFAADYTGAYQIYCLRNDSLYRWTNDDLNHLDPMVGKGVLYDRVYSAGGFLLDTAAIPVPGGLETRRDSLAPNEPFAAPASGQASRQAWGDDGMRFLGYSAFGRVERTLARHDLFGTTDRSSPLYGIDDPGGYKLTAGGAGVWMHPAEESQLFIEAGVSDDVNRTKENGPYLSEFGAFYSDRSFGPEIGGSFSSSTNRVPSRDSNQDYFDYTLLRFSLACDWRIGNYLSLSGFGAYSGVSLKSGGGLSTDFAGGGTVFGGQFQAVVYQPGVDFANRLFAFWTGLGYVPNFGVESRFLNWDGVMLAANSFRRVFYQASLQTASVFPDDPLANLEGTALLSLDLPASLRLPLPAERSLFLAAILPSVGIDYFAASAGTSSSAAAYASQRPRTPGVAARPWAFAQSASPFGLENGQADLLFSTIFKLVSPLNSLVYWDFYYALPIQGSAGDGYFGVNLSL